MLGMDSDYNCALPSAPREVLHNQHDEDTFRLVHMQTKRKRKGRTDEELLQICIIHTTLWEISCIHRMKLKRISLSWKDGLKQVAIMYMTQFTG